MIPQAVHEGMATQVAALEACLSELEAALAAGEPARIDDLSQRLQRRLAEILNWVLHVRQSGTDPLTPEWRARLQQAQQRMQRHQTAVHQATQSLERTLGALFPDQADATYGALGQSPSASAVHKAYR